MTAPENNSNSSSDENVAEPQPAAGRKMDARHPDGRKSFLAKWSTTILCLSLLVTPFVLFGATESLNVYTSDIRQWLPKEFGEAQVYDDFLDRFGVDEMLVVSWEDCQLENPQVLNFQNQLSKATTPEGKLWFERVTSGPQMLGQLRNMGVSNARARQRLDGLMIGPDKKTTCIIAYPFSEYKDDRKEIVVEVYELAEKHLGLSPAQVHMGGPTVEGAEISIESKKSLSRYLPMAFAFVFVLTWFRLRDLPLTLLVMLFAGLCCLMSLAGLYWCGGQMNLTLVMLPALTFILGVSGAVHMVNYYRKASSMGYGLLSADQAIVDGGYPVILSSVTTAVGLMSLAASSVTPIRSFGIFSGLGVLLSVGVLLLVLPATLYLLRGRISRRFSEAGPMQKRERTTGVSRSTSWLLSRVCRDHNVVVIPILIVTSVMAVGIFRLGADVKILNRFAPSTKIIKDYHWLENNLGPLVPMEIEVCFTPENDLSMWEKMQLVKSIERSVERTTDVNATFSAATFEPDMPRGKRLLETMQRRAKLGKWNSEFHRFQDAKLVYLDGDTSYWRISLRVAALNDIDYGRFLETVRENVDSQLEHMEHHRGVEATLTGGVPLIYKAQHQILWDLMISFLTAFLIITLIFIFLLKSVRAGLVAMIPNVFPPLAVFGTMGWLGYSIEIGSVMTASVALGIAVDDTLHFLTWYRRGTWEGLSRYAAIRFAFEHCAKAMIDTSLICGLGVLPFVFGVFMPTVKFAMMLTILLFVALLGDLILLPAILAGPAGTLFRLKRKPDSKSDAGTEE